MQITFMKAIASILFLSLILLSCSKDQRTINRLDGKWNVIAAEIQGYGESTPDLIYEFEYCKQKKTDGCDFSVHNFETNEAVRGVYSIINQGNTLSLTVSSGLGFQYREYTITRLSRNRLELTNLMIPQGELSRISLRRVKD